MAEKKTTNFDDYYANLPKTSWEEESNKSSLKLKIKIKKPQDSSNEKQEVSENKKEEASFSVISREKEQKIKPTKPSIYFEENKKQEVSKKENADFSEKKEQKFQKSDKSFYQKPKFDNSKSWDFKPKFDKKPPFKRWDTGLSKEVLEQARQEDIKRQADFVSWMNSPKQWSKPYFKKQDNFQQWEKRNYQDRPKQQFSNSSSTNNQTAPKTYFEDFESNDEKPKFEAGAPNLFNRETVKKEKFQWKSKFKGKWDFHGFSDNKFKWKWFRDDFSKAKIDDGEFHFKKTKSNTKSEKKEKNIEDIKQVLVAKTGQEVEIPQIITVKEFSDKIGIWMSKIIAECMKNWMMVNLNTKIDFDTCYILGESFGIKMKKEENKEILDVMDAKWSLAEIMKNEDQGDLEERAAIVSIMWHVDHGKTSILDYIRKTKVVAWEAGWITQKIWAYQVENKWKKITFLDTPWHEAFSVMRSRWAKLTDIAIIVVAADEWIMPQTIESINHAREAWVPIIVAANKIDKPGANIERLNWQLSEQWLQPESWGWDTVVVPVSAHTWEGIDTLLDMILLVSEMLELKANPSRHWVATIIESHLDPSMWPVATILVNTWTIKKWDIVFCGKAYGRLRILKDHKWKNIEQARPSEPAFISWLNAPVEWWDIIFATDDIEIAKAKAREFELLKSAKSIHAFEAASLENLLWKIKSGSLKQLKVVLKADSNWSLEALKGALLKLSTAETKVNIIHAWVWEINDSDVLMAWTSQAILISFNVWILQQARQTLQNSKIEFINKKVIYHILEKVESIINWMIDIRYTDEDLWEVKVKKIFYSGKDFMILWLGVLSWVIQNKSKARIIRDWKKIGNWEIVNLKSWVIDTNEIEAWEECWINFKWDIEKIQEGDILEVYKIVQRK